MIAAVAAAAAQLEAAGTRVAFVAGVDLAHVGARFGDTTELDAAALAEIETKDRAALAAALTGDAEAWFEAIAAHGDSTRICGFAAMYAMLRVAKPGAGRLLGVRAVAGGGRLGRDLRIRGVVPGVFPSRVRSSSALRRVRCSVAWVGSRPMLHFTTFRRRNPR